TSSASSSDPRAADTSDTPPRAEIATAPMLIQYGGGRAARGGGREGDPEKNKGGNPRESNPPTSPKPKAAEHPPPAPRPPPAAAPGRCGTTRPPSTHTDWVATTVSSQTPLNPFSNSGLSSASIKPGRMVYDSPTQSTSSTTQSTSPDPGESCRSTHPLPSTP